MDIETVLKTMDCRVTYLHRWLLWDDSMWCVYERKPYARTTNLLINTFSFEKAIEALVEEG